MNSQKSLVGFPAALRIFREGQIGIPNKLIEGRDEAKFFAFFLWIIS